MPSLRLLTQSINWLINWKVNLPRKAIRAVLAQLKKCKQSNMPISNYSTTQGIIKATNSTLHIRKHAHRGCSRKICHSVTSWNVNNPETPLILTAGNFPTLSDAITKAIALDNNLASNRILHFTTNRNSSYSNITNRNNRPSSWK